MSVKVNLLPRELEEIERGKRVTRLTIVGVLAFVVLLGGAYAYQYSEVRAAEADRDEASAEVAQLQTELESLAEFRELKDRYDARKDLLSTAMAPEISWARILNDFSLAFPSDASMLTLTAQAEEPEEPEPGEVDPGFRIGQVVTTGYSIERFAPGVETVLVDFEGATGFFNSYLQTAASADIGDTEVTNFNGTIDLNEDAYTNRYEDGLPPEVEQ